MPDKLDWRMIVEFTPFSLGTQGSTGTALLSLLAQLELPFAIIHPVEHQLVPCGETRPALVF
ncbi:MAG: hypothetical protein ACE1Y4_11020 [Lysobacterales bacterium]